MTESEFEQALHRGLGRAKQYVAEHGISNVFEIVLDACLHNHVYYGITGKWMYELVRDSAEFPKIRTAVLEALSTSTNSTDLEHLFAFSAEIARSGDQAALKNIQKTALAFASGTDPRIEAEQLDDCYWLGQSELISIKGIDAATKLAKCYGQRLLREAEELQDGESSEYGISELTFDDEHIDAKLIKMLPNLSQQSNAYSKYLDYRKMSDKPSPRSPRKRTVKIEGNGQAGLDRLLNKVRTKQLEYPLGHVGFGKRATTDELRQVFEWILESTEQEEQKQLLWVFRRTKLPQLHSKIFELAQSDNNALKGAASVALSHSQDKQIHQLAHKLLQKETGDSAHKEFLSLLILNYENGDTSLIIEWLKKQRVHYDKLHSLAWSLIDIATANNSAEITPLLEWAYIHTPCFQCRHRVVELLTSRNLISDSLLEECQLDADKEIRGLIQAHIDAKKH